MEKLSRPSSFCVTDQCNVFYKNNDVFHFCTTEIHVPQWYFWMYYIRFDNRQQHQTETSDYRGQSNPYVPAKTGNTKTVILLLCERA